ncbi:MAG TPA: 2-oxo acid dehydrogenase subunit E2, partial [Lacibacter sp.]|nr:2-oxo acid dehydrogenase subunit E2 [Lacibacter sp.]
MAEVIRMPLLSDTMTEGKIVAWNKKVGDKVKSDDVLADVETDKATMEVVGYADGVLLYVGVPEGKAAKINEIIAIVGKEGEEYKHLLDAPQSATSTPEPATSNQQPVTGNPQPTTSSTGVDADALGKQLGVTIIRMPLLSDTMTEGKIVAWNKKVGDAVASDDNLADVETDKATMEVVPYAEGTLLYTGVEAGKAAKVNEVIAIIGKAGTDITGLLAALNNPVAGAPLQAAASVTAETAPAASSAAATAATTTSTNGRIKASPLAKKIAAEKGIDLKAIQGSGDGGRIVKADIDNFTPAAAATAPSAPAASAPAVPAFNPGAGEGYVDTPNSSMRKTIARRLSDSLYTAPHFFLTMEINMDNAMAARTQLNELSPVKISFQDMTIKAAAMALRQHPAVNSSWMGDFIRTYQH